MTATFAPASPRPNPAPEGFLNFILDHNPLYLLSALSMLLGYYLLVQGVGARAGEIGKMVGLLVTVNIYELLLIGLGLFLFLRRGLRRDARLLLILQSLFLADATFMISETVSIGPRAGAVVDLVLLILALAKMTLVFRVLRLELSFRSFTLIVLQLAILFTLPIYLRHISIDGTLPGLPFYGFWWLALLLPLMQDLLSRFFPATPLARAAERAPEIRRVYFIVPFISLLAHLGMLHWVFRADFFAANLVPVLLGLAVALLAVKPSPLVPLPQIRFLQVAFCLVAILLSLGNPRELAIHIPGLGHQIMPLIVTLLATPLIFTYIFALRALPIVAATLALVALVYLCGPSAAAVTDFVTRLWKHIADFCDALIPRTSTAWGILAILSSFVLLALGALISLFRPRGQIAAIHND